VGATVSVAVAVAQKLGCVEEERGVCMRR
jgi:hypothetical protein